MYFEITFKLLGSDYVMLFKVFKEGFLVSLFFFQIIFIALILLLSVRDTLHSVSRGPGLRPGQVNVLCSGTKHFSLVMSHSTPFHKLLHVKGKLG